MNYILGSGLIAYIAKLVFPTFEIIPVGKSRFYQYNVATCDDYIFCHPDIDGLIGDITQKAFVPVIFKRAISVNGQLIFNKNEPFINEWLNKTYNNKPNPYGLDLIKMEGFAYNSSASDLFKILEPKLKQSFKTFVESGEKIRCIDTDNKIIHTSRRRIEYTNIINTIPLDALLKFCNKQQELESLDLHTFVVETDDLNFEGSSELLVIDGSIDFHKCTRIGKRAYQFFTTKQIDDLRSYLNLFMKKYDLISGTCVKNAVPIGPSPSLELPGIISVGSCAQWDDFMDVSSSIRRLKNAKMSK